MPELTESETVFFERARPEFERRLAAGEDAGEALKAAAASVLEDDERLYLTMHGVGRAGREAGAALRSAISELVYNRLRAAKP